MINKLLKKYKQHKQIIENFSYLGFLQFFLLIYPLITYPYLVKVLGRELYGVVLTAQMLTSYASLLIDFGSNYVCAKHVSINRDNPHILSEIVSNVLFVRFLLFIACGFIYLIVTLVIPAYRDHFWLFILTYAFTTNDLLFPQFFFQGIEKMKFISIINIVTKVLMVFLIFMLIKSAEDVLLVPVIYSIGYVVGGLIALYQIVYKMKIRFVLPTLKASLFYLKDSSSIFATDLICTIKDKLSYLLVGTFVGMSEVVIYDLGLKLHGIAAKPYMLISMVMFPRFAKNRNINQLKRVLIISFFITLLVVAVANIFLNNIVLFFIHEECELLPLRLFLIGPLILSISYILSNNMFVAFGYNRYVFYSMIITTSTYVICLFLAFIFTEMNTIMTFICISLISYVAELFYRLLKAKHIYTLEYSKEIIKQ